MKKYLLLALLICLAWPGMAQFHGGFYGGPPGGGRFGNQEEKEEKAKSEFHIKGKVFDEKNEPMVAVSVRLLSAVDSSLVRGAGTMTDDKGEFLLDNLKRGDYLVNISFLGYKAEYKEVKLLRVQPSADLGRIKMEPNAILLGEAVVTAVAPPIVNKEDTLEYNAESFKTQPNAAAEDLFKRLPGIDISEDGKITVQGKEVKKILVDGKEFFTDDPKVASKNLPANMIDKIQVVDRKSDEARFSGIDDGEEETVINLTVKPGMKQGWFGVAQAGGGTEMEELSGMYEVNASANRFVNSSQYSILGGLNNTNNQGASDLGQQMFSGSNRMMRGNNRGTGTTGMLGGNINTGTEDETFRVGGDIGYMANDRYSWSRSEQQNFLTADSSSFVKREGENINRGHNLNMNFRLRWEIDTLTNLEFMPRFSFNKSHLENNSFSETMGGRRDALPADRDSINDQLSESNSDAQGYNLSGRLSFSRAFKSDPRRRLSFSFNYSANRNEENGSSYDVLNFYRTGVLDSTRRQKDDNINSGASYNARATYVEPLSKHYYLNVVYQYRFNNNNGDAYTYNVDENDNYVDKNETTGEILADEDFSNVSRSRYQTHRGEIALRGVYTKMNFNVGLNMEHQKRETRYLFGRNTGNDITQRSLNFSPTLRMRYRITKHKNFRLNYRCNSSQPSARQLQAAPDVTNPLNIYIGNPNLNSSFSHNVWTEYRTYNPETMLSFSINASANVTQNSIVEKTIYGNGQPMTINGQVFTIQDGGRARIPVNVNGDWDASIWSFFNMPFKRNKQFSLNSFTRLGYDRSIGFVSVGRDVDFEKNTSHDYNLSEDLSLRYSSETINASIGANYSYSLSQNTLQTDNNESYMNFGARADLNWFHPSGVSIGTDCRYRGTAGYAEGYNQHKVMWNASIAYSFLKKKSATLRFKVYDILRQNNNISRSVTSSYIQDQESNSLGSYCMLYFAYQFNTIGGGREGGRGGFGGPGGGRGPRGYEGF